MSGVKELRMKLRRLPGELKDEIRAIMNETIDAVHADGLANIDRMTEPETGTLRKHYKRSRANRSLRGYVGFKGKRAAREAWYARHVHDGTRYAVARPFHDRADLKHLPRFHKRMKRAAEAVLRRGRK